MFVSFFSADNLCEASSACLSPVCMNVQACKYCVCSYSSPRPVVVEMLEQKDEIDGLPEKFMNKNPEFAKLVLNYYIYLM